MDVEGGNGKKRNRRQQESANGKVLALGNGADGDDAIEPSRYKPDSEKDDQEAVHGARVLPIGLLSA